MWVIAANDYVIEWRLRVSSVVVPPFSNSTPCFVWIQGQRGSALVSLAQSKTLAWPPPPRFKESKFASRFPYANTEFGVWYNFFLPQRGSERREPVCEARWCDELLLQFSTVQPWSGLHVSERKSLGVEGVGVVFCSSDKVHQKGSCFFSYFPLSPLSSFSPHGFNILDIIKMHLFGSKTSWREYEKANLDGSLSWNAPLQAVGLCTVPVCTHHLYVFKWWWWWWGVSQTHQQQEAVDRLVCTPLVQQSGTETGDKRTRESPERGRGNQT